MAKIILLKGLPASGKSTWAKEKLDTGKYFRVSKDDIRLSMLGKWSRRKEKDVVKVRDRLIRLGIELDRTVIVDDTNLNPIHETTIKAIADELQVPFEVNDSFLSVGPEECIERDLSRQNSVGASVIWEMYDKYVRPNQLKLLDKQWEKRRCVIFDIDGTLAHNTSNRSYFDFTKVDKDTPDPFLSTIVDALTQNEDYYLDVVIVSGRDGSCRKETEDWLDKNMISYHSLFMREAGDTRDDTVVKEEIYHREIEPNWAVLGVFDDRPKVVRMWRRLGINVAQMGNPNIEF